MSLFFLSIGDYCSDSALYEKMMIENSDVYLNNICYHLQQCIEKTLKDYLVQYNLSIDKTHDIFRLIDDIQTNADNIDLLQNEYLEKLKYKANTITSWEVTTRYYDSFLETIDNIKSGFIFAIRGMELNPYKIEDYVNLTKETFKKIFDESYMWKDNKNEKNINDKNNKGNSGI